METDTYTWWAEIAENILNGKLSDPYHDLTLEGLFYDRWRLQPPFAMWWYTLNYTLYGLNPFYWRLLNLLIEFGIVYVMYKIFSELQIDERYFKIGFAFYIFSILPIHAITLYANYIAFPVLLGLLGVLFYLKSRTDENYLYLSILCFTLNALSAFYGTVWLLGILLLLLFRRDFNLLIIVLTEIAAIFCIVCFPFLMHDAIGFLQRLTWILQLAPLEQMFTTIWLIDIEFITYVPAIFAIILTAIYVYKNRNREISIEFFIIILSIFLIFTPAFGPYYLLWLIPLISINIIYSFRKFITTHLFFIIYFYITYFLVAYAIVLYSPSTHGWAGLLNYMTEIGLTKITQIFGQIFFQLGLIYLIYSYTKQKFWVYTLITPFIIYHTIFLLFGV
ncbi:MAG: hypothetical protein HWN66_00590 [Candidatus Helarchaeota archaeon]|nr:hypothetical protein [Candidatus Helarchaeota archaeon]